jgi:hypothetical protein
VRLVEEAHDGVALVHLRDLGDAAEVLMPEVARDLDARAARGRLAGAEPAAGDRARGQQRRRGEQ